MNFECRPEGLSASASSDSSRAASDSMQTRFHSANALSGSLSNCSRVLTSVRSPTPIPATVFKAVLPMNGATARRSPPPEIGCQGLLLARPPSMPRTWNATGSSEKPSGAGNRVCETSSASARILSSTERASRSAERSGSGRRRMKSARGRHPAVRCPCMGEASVANAMSQERSKVRFRDRTATRIRDAPVSDWKRSTQTLGWNAPPPGARTG